MRTLCRNVALITAMTCHWGTSTAWAVQSTAIETLPLAEDVDVTLVLDEGLGLQDVEVVMHVQSVSPKAGKTPGAREQRMALIGTEEDLVAFNR